MDKETMAAMTGMAPNDMSQISRETHQYQQSQQPAEPQTHVPDVGLSRDPEPETQQQPTAPQQPQSEQYPGQQQQDEASVPSYRLREEREARTKLEEQVRAMEQREKTLSDRFAMLQENWQSVQKNQLSDLKAETPPDPAEDLQAYVMWQNKRVEELENTAKKYQEEAQYNNQVQAVVSQAKADETTFLAQNPDFQQAHAWYRNQQLAELQAMGIDPMTASNHVNTMELEVAAISQRNGQNSAENVYKAAVARGWKPQQQQPMQQPMQQDNVTPIAANPQYEVNQGQQVPQHLQPQMNQLQQQQAMQQQPQYQPHGQTLQNMNEAMLHSRTLDEAPPGETQIPFDMNRVGDMSEAEFMDFYLKNGEMLKDNMRRMMAG